MFLRKLYNTSRSLSVFISFFLPLMLQIVGSILVYFMFGRSENPKNLLIIDFLSVYNVLAYCFSTSNFCGTLVMERELKLKYALNVMGCRPLPYWLGTFIFDFTMYFVGVVFFVALFYIF